MSATDLNTLLKTIGQNLHTIRNARKETLQAVASDIGTTHPVISKIENGQSKNLTLSLLIKLCNHYNIPLHQVLSLEIANIFQLTQHNKSGSQKIIGQEVASGYDLFIRQLQNENTYLKEQLHLLLSKIPVK
jgi:transcriptional regulator with XRE-family HTH domain